MPNIRDEKRKKKAITFYVILCFTSIISLWLFSASRKQNFSEKNVVQYLQESFQQQLHLTYNYQTKSDLALDSIMKLPITESSIQIVKFSNQLLASTNSTALSYNELNTLPFKINTIAKYGNSMYYISRYEISHLQQVCHYYFLIPLLDLTNYDEKIVLSNFLNNNILAQQLLIKDYSNAAPNAHIIYYDDNGTQRPAFTIEFLSDNYIKSTTVQLILIILFSLSFLLSVHTISILWINYKKYFGLLIEGAFLIIGWHICKNIENIVTPFNDKVLFASSFLSSNEYFNNLYELIYILTSIGLFCTTIISIFITKPSSANRRNPLLITLLLFGGISAFCSYFLNILNSQVVNTVVFDSKISLVSDNFQYLNYTSFLGTCIIIGTGIISILIIYIVYLTGLRLQLSKAQQIILFLGIEIIVGYTWAMQEHSYLLYLGIALKVLVYFFIQYIPPPIYNNSFKYNKLNWQIWLLIISIYGVSLITLLNNLKEIEFREHYATNNFKVPSVKLEYNFQEQIEDIKKDEVLLTNDFNDNTNLGNYIKTKYFPKLSTEIAIKCRLEQTQPLHSILDSLEFCDNFSQNYSYSYVFPRVNDFVVITITAKDIFYYKKNKIEETIVGKTTYSDVQYLAKYNTAKYQNNKLVTFDGMDEFPRSLSETYFELRDKNGFYRTSNLNASTLYAFNDDGSQCVIIIYKRNLIMQTITTLSTILIIFLISFIGILLYSKIIFPNLKKQDTGKHLGINSKINITLIVVITTAFIIVGLTVVNIISVNDKSNYQNKQAQNLAITESFLQNTHTNFNFNINTLIDKFNIVALLYDSSGVLVGHPNMISTNEYLSNKYILSPSVAEKVLQSKDHYLTIQDDNNFYNYITILSKSELDGHQVILKIFDYNSTTATGENTSDIILGIINILILIIFVVSIITYFLVKTITKPLEIITQKFKDISLKHNERIDWPNKDEFSLLVNEYNNMLLKLEQLAQKLSEQERENLWKEVAQQVAHEIKNPLTPMRLNIQYLQRAIKENRDNIPDLTNKVCNVILEQIDTLNRIATEFSTIAKIDVPQPEVFVLHDLVLNLRQLFVSSDNIEIDYLVEDKNILLQMDKTYLIRSLTNLLKNAIQAVPNDKTKEITIQTVKDHTVVTIVITDNGTGISPEMEDKLFKPYFTSKTSGTGIGLNMTKKMIELSGGSITYKTIINEGTSFIITLPIYAEK